MNWGPLSEVMEAGTPNLEIDVYVGETVVWPAEPGGNEASCRRTVVDGVQRLENCLPHLDGD
jgi:hypothetical protein